MNLRIYLSGLLREMQISPKYLGYLYLETIVLYAFENRLYLKSLSRFVYPEVAKKFETAPKSVEKAVENAISRTFQKGGMSAFCPNNCPSCKEVISYFVNRLTEYSYKCGNLSQVTYR